MDVFTWQGRLRPRGGEQVAQHHFPGGWWAPQLDADLPGLDPCTLLRPWADGGSAQLSSDPGP